MASKLLILGGGYAGTTLVEQLKDNPAFEVTLINDTPKHLAQTKLHRFLSDASNLDEIAFDLKRFSQKNNAAFICAKVIEIDYETQEVFLHNGKSLPFDKLVIATGAISFFPQQIKNINSKAKDIKKLEVLENSKEEFLKLLNNPKKNKNIAIVGGGLSGVEVAVEFAQKIQQVNDKHTHVTLIEQLPTLLPNMDPFLIEQTTKRCNELNIQQIHGHFVSEVKEESLELSNGESVAYDMVLFIIGVTSEPLGKVRANIERNIKNQFVVDEYLRLPAYPNVYCIGDIAQTKDKNGNFVLPTAQMAKLQAKLLAKNLKRELHKQTLLPNNLETKGVLIDLAGKIAAGVAKGVKLKGIPAYALKRFVCTQHTKMFVR